MADVDLQQQLLAQQSLLQSSQGAGGKGAIVLAGILPGSAKDIDCFSGLTPKGKGLNGDKTLPLPKAQPGMFAKLLESTGFNRAQILEGLKKCNMPVQSSPTEAIQGSNLPRGMAGVSSPNDGQGIG